MMIVIVEIEHQWSILSSDNHPVIMKSHSKHIFLCSRQSSAMIKHMVSMGKKKA